MKAQVNGIEIEYQVEGKGPWVTLAHALGVDRSMWDAQVELLAERFSVLRYDCRGHGRSSAPEGPYSLERLAQDALGLFDALGVERTHFIGLSMGGMIAQHVALAAPQRIASLVLADTTSRYPAEAAPVWQERIRIVAEQGMEPMVAPTLERWFTAPFRDAHPEVMERIGGLIRATPPAGYTGCCHAIPRIDVTARLRKLDMPALVLVGEQDAGTPPAMAEEIHEALSGSQLEVIPDAAHLSNIEQAEAFNYWLLGFLGAHSRMP
jgi:3-oxoadipate enol-lactonase